ncbi:MAG TPA: DUF1549 and DUF1553 domain-containing protein [Pirellulales bacterium]|nr:DUF1549 and DUF1553 domain-containing protein [Pirellulales bacterium]
MTVAVGVDAARADATITKIEVFPPDVNLNTARDRQRIIVMATRTDGVTLDVTAQAQATLANPALAKLASSTLYPQADGETTLNVSFGGHAVQAAVKVKDATADRPISFNLDVMPVFMRSGCNTGSCHGAARGKDGFRLSLFGFDPQGDHFRLTREIPYRRINLAVPVESLLLEKTDGTVPHTGGKRYDRDSELYATLLRWLEAGAPYDAKETPKVVEVELYPKQIVLEGEGATQQMVARAKYADGTDRDVTDLAVFLTNNDNSAPISPEGLVTAANRGEAFVMARFETHTVGSQALVLPKDLQYSPPQAQPVNYVDELVNAKLRKLRLLPSELCNDETFLRRVTIDIAGVLPTVEEYQQFTTDQDPAKRAKLIDRLLDRKEFSEIWAMKWAELLIIRSSNQVSKKSAFLYANWLTAQIQENVPLNKMVQELLGASGGTFKNPPTNYYQIERDTLKTAENVAQVFMGIRTQCAQCHNHPFDRWTMDDYYSFAAFFSQIGRKQGEDYRETIVFNSGGGEVKHPVGGRVMPPKFLGGEQPDVKGKDRREALAAWLASPNNPYFATSVANRVWDHFFGIGIVQPVDDVRVSNPASNPELYQALGEKFTQYNYDFKQLVRDICNSNAYQRSTQRNASNESDELNFAHSRIRRIRAESLLDCISQATDTKDKFPGLPLGSRAVQVADGQTSTYFLTTFGRSTRNTVCSCEVNTEPTLSQSLHMINGDTIEGKIRNGGLIQAQLKEGKTPDQIVESIYIRCLCRKPSAEELAKLNAAVAEEKNPQAALQDIFWAVLNSREFMFNH